MDDLVTAREDRRDVELAADSLRRSSYAAGFRDRLRRSQQRPRRHAGIEGALAADEIVFDDCDAQPAVGEAPRAHLPARAGTDDDDVEL